MVAPAARHAHPRSFGHGAFEDEAGYGYDELLPGERIVPIATRGRGKAVVLAAALLLGVGGGWALVSGKVTWPNWSLRDIAALFPEVERLFWRPADTGATAAVSPRPAGLPPAKPLTALPPAPAPALPQLQESRIEPAEPVQERPVTTAALPPAAPSASEPQPPPAADPADPLQARALAAGLHPGLSRVLLERLTPADYQNARVAIQTAVAETPDSGVLVWPKQRKPELALFHVRFVPGAAPNCRRYVVTVAKDGWTTTALPMEKCGAELGRTRRG
jgi:hypothetical protein